MKGTRQIYPYLSYFFLSRGGGKRLNNGAEHQIILPTQNKEAVVFFKNPCPDTIISGNEFNNFFEVARFTVDCKTRFLFLLEDTADIIYRDQLSRASKLKESTSVADKLCNFVFSYHSRAKLESASELIFSAICTDPGYV